MSAPVPLHRLISVPSCQIYLLSSHPC
jgi:hypothetical protein